MKFQSLKKQLTHRLEKTLYYGKLPKTERPSFPLTNVAVEFFNQYVGESLDRLCVEHASQFTKEACVNPTTIVLAIIYLERLASNPSYTSSVTPSQLFLVSILVASKYLQDEGCEDEVFNDEFAASFDIPLPDLNQLERDFIQALNWNLFASETEFFGALLGLEQKLALKQSTERNWMTYTEVDVLCDNSVLVGAKTVLLNQVVKVIAACLATYFAAITTLFVSAAVTTNVQPYLKSQLSPLHVPTVQNEFANPAFRDATEGTELQLLAEESNNRSNQTTTSTKVILCVSWIQQDFMKANVLLPKCDGLCPIPQLQPQFCIS
uniref:Protein CNPPD1 n=1 Tax=Lynceus sp. MCZ IZ 141354 TaxID=1930659 RepID=A0A9N6WR56_9CRUS|nr:EOG090X069C [Lynceus sp. MCZ IZ 141354]